jgi:hypothetical protein
MAVAYGAADGFSYICAVYMCDCGSRTAMHAHKAGILPPGWFSREGPEGLAHICPDCAARDPERAEHVERSRNKAD